MCIYGQSWRTDRQDQGRIKAACCHLVFLVTNVCVFVLSLRVQVEVRALRLCGMESNASLLVRKPNSAVLVWKQLVKRPCNCVTTDYQSSRWLSVTDLPSISYSIVLWLFSIVCIHAKLRVGTCGITEHNIAVLGTMICRLKFIALVKWCENYFGTSAGLGIVLKFLKFWNLSWSVLKLELGPEICTYILKFSRVFTIFFKNTHHFTYFTYE